MATVSVKLVAAERMMLPREHCAREILARNQREESSKREEEEERAAV